MGLLDFFVSIFRGTSDGDIDGMAFEPTSSIVEMEDIIKSDKENNNSNEDNESGSCSLKNNK